MRSGASPGFVGVSNALWIPGRILFSLSIVGLGIETIVCARAQGYFLGPGSPVIPCLPWLPAIPMVAGIFGVIWASCGMGLLAKRGLVAARILGTLLLLCALVTVLPKYLADPANIMLRTALFEPLALAGIALLQPGRDATPQWLEFGGRFLLGLSLVVFGLDCFLGLEEVAKLLPAGLSSPERYVEVYGAALVLLGLAVVAGLFQRWAPAMLGLLVAVWAALVHLPVVFASLTAPDAPIDANAWSSLFFAVGLWGGLWTLVRRYPQESRVAERPVYAARATGGSRRHLS